MFKKKLYMVHSLRLVITRVYVVALRQNFSCTQICKNKKALSQIQFFWFEPQVNCRVCNLQYSAKCECLAHAATKGSLKCGLLQ